MLNIRPFANFLTLSCLALISLGTSFLSAAEKPKILITNFHEYKSGGHRTYIRSLIESPELTEQYEFALAAPKTSDLHEIAQELGTPFYEADFPHKWVKEFSRMLSALKHIREICKTYHPDIIHCNGGSDHAICALGTLFLKDKPKIVRTIHTLKATGNDPYHLLLYNYLTDANLLVCQAILELNPSLKNTHIITNKVDLTKLQPQPKNEILKSQLGIPQDVFIFGSCAGLSAYKRIDLIIEATKHLKDKYNFHVIALGNTHGQWTQLAKELGVSDRVHIIPFQADVRPYCSIFDAGFILSDREETISYAAREMMAMGIPLISSSFAGLKENVDHKLNGLLVEPGDLNAVIEAMEYFLNLSPEDLSTYHKNARIKAEAEFDIHVQLHEIATLYNSLLQGATPSQQ